MVSHSPQVPDAYRRLAGPIRAKCRRMLGDTQAAEDVAQEVFLRLWQAAPTLEGDSRAVVSWAYRTSSRIAIDVLRERRKTEPLDSAAEAHPCGLHLEGVIAARATIALLAADVPDDELETALLCRVDGLSQPEAAGIMGISERTIRRLLERFDVRTESTRKEYVR